VNPSQVVAYQVDDETVARFEIEPLPGFVPAGVDELAGWLADAADPAIRAARVLLARVRELSPDEVQVKFGVKVTGTANWIIARASTDANFEVSLSWKPRDGKVGPDGTADPG
jgi:hypothetical protein